MVNQCHNGCLYPDILPMNKFRALFSQLPVGQLIRSVKLGKGFSDTTIKMYLAVFLLCIVSNLSLASTLTPDILNSALFAAMGFVFGATLKN